ncbi:ras guanine nucleotide exchange factor domain-containing protein [Cristinia sonorae]|uniref:Ras guanine nucleotide exchange factor domain-containing protein n=1 Tax=Cristinia sonorae TaxID=1940300 RepID=A0A8K0UUJ7_9AGAR|nr:ras guanine nucleotide exchange factor domain-containing protein [Cristinia sonorae]
MSPPRVQKESIGSPMALMPRVIATPEHYDRPLPPLPHEPRPSTYTRTSPSARRVEAVCSTVATRGARPSVVNDHRHVRTVSHAPFPSTTSNPAPSPAIQAPANTPRGRFHSDAARLPLSTLSFNDALALRSSAAPTGADCSISLVTDCCHMWTDFRTLIDACKLQKTFQVCRLSGIFISAVERFLRKFQTYPDVVKEADMVVAATKGLEFSLEVMRSFVDSIPREVREEKQRETSQQLGNLAFMVWGDVRVLMRVSYQEELYHIVDHELGAETSSSRSTKNTSVSGDSQAVTEVTALLKRSLLGTSVGSVVAMTAGVTDYFTRMARTKLLPKPRKSLPDRSRQQEDQSAAKTVFTRRAVDSFIMVENKSPVLREEPNDHKPLDDYNYIQSPAQHKRRTALRDSNVFITAASSVVSGIPEQGFSIDLFHDQWLPAISPSDFVKDTRRDPLTGQLRDMFSAATFTALVQIVLENIGDWDSAEFIDAFFQSFRFHAHPTLLLNQLIGHYQRTAPAHCSTQRPTYSAFRKYGKMQVVKVLRLWLDSHWEEKSDHEVRQPLLDFVNTVVATDRDLPGATSSLLKTSVARRQHSKASVSPEVKEDRRLYPQTAFRTHIEHMANMASRKLDISLVDIVIFHNPGGAEELARALTVIESDFFHGFEPKDISAIRYRQEPKSFKEWERFSVALGWWVVSSILAHKSVDSRIKATELFIDIAHICFKNLRNFSSSQCIVQALDHVALTRLESTINFITLGHKSTLRHMSDFFWGIHDYHHALKIAKAAVPIPYLIRHDISKINKSCASNAHRRTTTGERMIDMHYYLGIRRTIRALERIHVRIPLPRVKVILQWIEASCKPFIGADYEDLRTKIMTRSYEIEHAKPNPLGRSSWVTEEDRKRAFYDGYLP